MQNTPVQFLNCQPSDRLGYPAYFRAAYRKSFPATTSQLQSVVNSIQQAHYGSGVAVPLHLAPVAADDSNAILDVRVVPEGKEHVVAALADDYAPSVLDWVLRSVELQSITRVGADEVYGVSGDASREQARQQAAANNPSAHLAHVITVAVVVIVVVVSLYYGVQLFKVARGLRVEAA